MPAKSKSQQRLFGMVHAYNKGEFHGSRSLRNRLAALSKHISDDDARHFAETKHKGLPETTTKEAQMVFSPTELERAYASINTFRSPEDRSTRRRSILGKALRGTVVGTAVGGAGTAALGVYLANQALQSKTGLTDAERTKALQDAGIRCGLWGAGKGALAGAITGLGLGVLDKVRGES